MAEYGDDGVLRPVVSAWAVAREANASATPGGVAGGREVAGLSECATKVSH